MAETRGANQLHYRPCPQVSVSCSFHRGDVVQLVRTLPRRRLESRTVTAHFSLILNIIICFQA